ncbi:MAG: AMP-binding protein [Thermoleophilaceae bacterium]
MAESATGAIRPDSLVPRLEAAAERGRSVVFPEEDPSDRISWAQIHEDARGMAATLQARGLGPGDRVALLGPTSRALVTAIQAAWLAGATLTVPPLRSRLVSEQEFWGQTRARLELTDAALTVADPALTAGLEGLSTVTLPDLGPGAGRPGPDDYEPPPEDPEAVAVLQFTSGSTADPKGVMIPHRCIADNLDAVSERRPIDADDDVVVSWLPLYHDMGLIYVLTQCMTVGADLVISTPQHFIASPARWMESMSAFGGTWTIGPNYAFAVSARMLRRLQGRLELSACRSLGSGSEPIDPQAMRDFESLAAGHGLPPAAMYGAYGMAEATVCISAPPAGSGLTVDVIDGTLLEHEHRAEPLPPDHPRATTLARVGPPLRSMETRIVDPDTGTVLEDRHLGEIEVRGPSVVPGYFRRPDATAAAFREEGWLRTGDLGYRADGDLVIGGRLSDIIIVGGRNVFPQDLERAAETTRGVRPGNVVAFGTEGRQGREEVVVAAEVKVNDLERVRRDMARAVGEAVGIRPADVVLVLPGTLPKTSSGKLRRSLCRARYLRSELVSA